MLDPWPIKLDSIYPQGLSPVDNLVGDGPEYYVVPKGTEPVTIIVRLVNPDVQDAVPAGIVEVIGNVVSFKVYYQDVEGIDNWFPVDFTTEPKVIFIAVGCYVPLQITRAFNPQILQRCIHHLVYLSKE